MKKATRKSIIVIFIMRMFNIGDDIYGVNYVTITVSMVMGTMLLITILWQLHMFWHHLFCNCKLILKINGIQWGILNSSVHARSKYSPSYPTWILDLTETSVHMQSMKGCNVFGCAFWEFQTRYCILGMWYCIILTVVIHYYMAVTRVVGV